MTGFYKVFRQYLIAVLYKQDFADLYAQTITYGLFAARTRAEDGTTFTRRNARDYIPATIGILRDLFEFISYRELPQNIGWIMDDIAEILDAADINQILDRYYDEGKGKDPIIHFYETFLAEYNPDLREQRGVYYTPESVVAYIVRSVLDKWLYDRRERKLSNKEIQHYCRVVTVLFHTLELQKKIDEIYPGVEQEVINWNAG
ncbi:MAG: hypothetical protein R3281_06145 [Balneolaceae bacterium]|nr:hypothetical protein [Balneolaceae bacterium]